MSDLDAMLAGIVTDPLEETRWLVLADYLEEHDDPRRAELLRLHRKLIATCCEPEAQAEREVWQSRMVELLVAGVKPCVRLETLTLPRGVPMTFAFIPPGSFLMGSENGEENERPVHRVTITRGFFMGVHPVTQAQWEAVMGDNPSHFKGADRPVETVSWDECQEFCAKLTAIVDRDTNLPTEAEWEYACRAGTTSEFWNGNGEDALKNVGWFVGNSDNQTKPAGKLAGNPWSLFDVHGNIWEWCQDHWDDSFYQKSKNYDPICIDSITNNRVLRGGSWHYDPESCRAAFRNWIEPADRDYGIGFRVRFRLD